MKNTYLVLAAAYLSFIALGFFDGAFAVAWPVIRYDMNLRLDQAGLIIIINSVFYTLSSSQVGRFSRSLRPETVNVLGILAIMLGLLGLSAAPGLAPLVLAGGVAGIGMGMVDFSLNLYIAKHFSSRYMNWLHCCWSIGATFSPIVMFQMVLIASWRAGYVALASIQGIIAAFVVLSLIRGVWSSRERVHIQRPEAEDDKRFLTHPRFQYLHIAIFFLYMGADYSVGFWTASVLLESRGLGIDAAGAYPAVYFASIMLGRITSGYLAKRLSNIAMIRAGFLLAVAGLAILTISNTLMGMALIGLGFAPVYPCLMHETSRRFCPDILTKLVGYQVAAAALGVAILGPAMGLTLSRFSSEALFPLAAVMVVLVFVFNEIVDSGYRKAPMLG